MKGNYTNGKYFVDVELGTPPQSFQVLVDSGSADFVVPSVLCGFCTQRDRYNITASKTGINLCRSEPTKTTTTTSHASHSSSHSSSSPSPSTRNKKDYDFWLSRYNALPVRADDCQWLESFGSGFVTGTSVSDVMRMGDMKQDGSARAVFGSFYYEQEMQRSLPPPIDGVFGLIPYSSVAIVSNRTVMQTLFDRGLAEQFSLCLGLYGGTMLLGGVDTNLFAGNLSYTPIKRQTYFVVQGTSLALGGEAATTSGSDGSLLNPVIVDTGVQRLLVESGIYGALASLANRYYCSSGQELPGMCSGGLFAGNCYFIDEQQLALYPSLTLTLQNNVALRMAPDTWLMPTARGRCLAIALNDQGAGTRIGTQMLSAFFVHFDIGRQRIGFAPSSNCTGAEYILHMVSGNEQIGTIERSLDHPFVVQVNRYNDSLPAADVLVNFQIVAGDGSLSHVPPTDEQGLVRCTLTPGAIESQILVTATLKQALHSPLVFSATSQQSSVYDILSLSFTILLVAALMIAWCVTERHRKLQYERLMQSPVYRVLAEKKH
jgi:Eukaryotic aspartyl protease